LIRLTYLQHGLKISRPKFFYPPLTFLANKGNFPWFPKGFMCDIYFGLHFTYLLTIILDNWNHGNYSKLFNLLTYLPTINLDNWHNGDYGKLLYSHTYLQLFQTTGTTETTVSYLLTYLSTIIPDNRDNADNSKSLNLHTYLQSF
jgi:hypothetical protein